MLGALLTLALLATTVGQAEIAVDCFLGTPLNSHSTSPSEAKTHSPHCPQDGPHEAYSQFNCMTCSLVALPTQTALLPSAVGTPFKAVMALSAIEIADRPFHPPQSSVLPST